MLGARRGGYAARVLPRRALIGMVHVAALPGSPRSRRGLAEIERLAVAEALTLAKAGFHGVIVENMHDRPYVNAHGPETTACMTRVALAVRGALPDIVLGIQVLSLGHKEALAVAVATGGAFVRVENFVFAHVADEGLMATAVAGELLRYRRQIGAEGVRVVCDVKKKHASHAITGDVSVGDACRAVEFFGGEGVIVTGAHTGDPTSRDDLDAARAATRLPVWVGSGVTAAQVGPLLERADALIVGSAIKRGGVWSNPVDPERARSIVRAAKKAR